MGQHTEISWCDSTFNGWEGCEKVSPGCAHCYAEARNHRFGLDNWGPGKPRRRTSEANWRKPLAWNKHGWICDECGTDHQKQTACESAIGHRPRVFCSSLSDWLDDQVQIEWLDDLLKLIHDTPNLDWLLLSKRPENWRGRLARAAGYRQGSLRLCDEVSAMMIRWLDGFAPANVWIGTTCEDQKRADERIPELLKIPAKVRFLSCEPLLEEIDIEADLDDICDGGYVLGSAPIHWVICGGESSANNREPNIRPMHPDWARSLRDQCQAAGVPFLFKQWGDWLHTPEGFSAMTKERMFLTPDGKRNDGTGPRSATMSRVGKKAAGRLLDGREWNEFPKT